MSEDVPVLATNAITILFVTALAVLKVRGTGRR
jgi:hypothetical protein